MTGPARHPLHLLLALLIPLGGLSEFEVRHRHEEGGAPHKHEHPVAVASAGHRHDHGGEGGHGHPHRDDRGETPDDFGIIRAESAHAHRFWPGDLFRATSSGSGERPASDGDGTDADPVEFARLQGQPGGQADGASLPPAGLPPMACSIEAPAAPVDPFSRHLRSDRNASPPLCDRARHERSGVLLT